MIFRGVLVPTKPPVDVALIQFINPLAARISDPITFALQIINLGPVTASGVVVTQSFSSALTHLGWVALLGAAAYTN